MSSNSGAWRETVATLSMGGNKKQQTRALAIETAADLIGERGIAATCTIDVAERAGAADGTVFVHFPTRERLTARKALTAHLEDLGDHEAFHARLVMEGRLLPPHASATLVGTQSAISGHLADVAEREMSSEYARPPAVQHAVGLGSSLPGQPRTAHPRGSVVERGGQMLLDHYVALLRPDEERDET